MTLSTMFDKLPHSLESEMCLIASMMLDGGCIPDARATVTADDFFSTDHQIIFDVLVKLYEQNRPVDAVILRDELKKRQLFEEVGGSEYLAAIPGHPAPREMISGFTGLQGEAMGVANAVLFRAWDSQARPALLEELQAAQEQKASAEG